MKIFLPFREDYPLTQAFGANIPYYASLNVGLTKGHEGLDYGCPTGTPITACDDGTIMRVQDTGSAGYGRNVKIQHPWGESLYGHLNRSVVTQGAPIKAGQILGYSNNTGNSSGPHLHFGIRIYPFDQNDGHLGFSDPAPYLVGHYTPSGDTPIMDTREKFALIFSVLHSNPNPTPQDIDGAVGSALDPYNYGTQDLNNRVIKDTIAPYLSQIATLQGRVKELENEIQTPSPIPPGSSNPPQEPNQPGQPVPPVPGGDIPAPPIPSPSNPNPGFLSGLVRQILVWLKSLFKRG